MARLYRRGRIWWLRWYAGGRLFYKSLKTANRRVALYHKARKEGELAQGKHRDVDADLLLSEAFQLYLESCRPRKTPHSFLTDELRLRKITQQLGPMKLSQLSPGRIESCLTDLVKQNNLHASTRNHYLKLLRAFGNWCVQRGYLWENPTKGIQRIKATTTPRVWLTKEQRDRLLALAEKRKTVKVGGRSYRSFHFPMMATAALSGLRYRELVTLEWPDVDFDQNVIHVRPKDGWAPKSKKGRIVPLHPKLKVILSRCRQEAGICFPTPSGKPYRSDPRPQVLRRLFQTVGVEGRGLGWHTLRHTFASLLVQQGVSIWKVCEWLGHADVRTTQVYSHLAPKYDADISRV